MRTRTFVIYILLTVFCMLCGYLAEKKNNKKILWFAILALSILYGLRDYSVGIDTHNYRNMFESLTSIHSPFNYGYSDPYFYVVAFFIKTIFHDIRWVFFIFGLLMNALYLFRLWDYREISSMPYAILRYIGIFYFFSFNCMRQFVAVSIVFWFTKYLREKHYIRFLIGVGIASFMHSSAIISIAFLVIELLQTEHMTKKDRNLLIICVLALPVALYLAYGIMEDRYADTYLSSVYLSSWLSMGFKLGLGFAAIPFLLQEMQIKCSIVDSSEYGDSSSIKYQTNKVLVYYWVGLLMSIIGLFYRFVDRIAYPFYVFGPIYVGMLTKIRRHRWIYILLVLFVVLRAYYQNCSAGSMGQMPYIFYWE